MFRGTLAIVATVCLIGSPARAQVRHPVHAPTNYNNPLNQAGMYNNNALQFNNPLNQAGMYANNPALRFNNPLNQANMYGGANWNNPMYQGNYNYGGFNNPTYQGNFNYGGFNNATTQGNGFNGFSTGRSNGGAAGSTRVNANASAILNGSGVNNTNPNPARTGRKFSTKGKSRTAVSR